MLREPKPTQRMARELRAEMSLPEVKLWQVLRSRPGGLRFRRQHPAGAYVLDFYCPLRLLAIEIDGEADNRGDRPERDKIRDAWLAARGVTVVRIPASAVLDDIDSALIHIVEVALRLPPLHQPAAGPPPLAGEDE